MVYITTTKNSILYNIFETLKNLECESFMLKISPENIHIQSSDVAKISILDAIIEKKYFETYKVEDTINLDLDIDFINKISKLFNKKTNTLIKFKDNYLYIETIKNDKNDIEKQFRLNVNYNTNFNIIDINKLQINNEFRLETKTFLDICSDLNVFNDDFTITMTDKNTCFSSNTDCGDIQYYIDYLTNNTNIQVSFKLKYLIKFKLLNLFEHINFKLENEKPLFLNLKDSNININYILAPNYICD